MGYWAIFVTVAAEQFGTNLRATVATTVPNFARGFLVPLTFLFTELTLANVSVVATGCLLTVICFGFAFLAVWKMEETYGKDLDYLEIQLVRSMTGEGTFNLAKETPE
jgi:putative MFS transporter